MVDTLRLNHDEVQTVTAVKRFHRKLAGAHPLHTFVLGVPKHQKIMQSKIALVLANACSTNVLRRQNNNHKLYTVYNSQENKYISLIDHTQIYSCLRDSKRSHQQQLGPRAVRP